MKNKEMFANYMTMMTEIFDKTITEITRDAYWKILDPFDDEQCEKAFKAVISTSKFFPKPSDLLDFIEGPQSDKAIEAWLKVDHAVRHVGNYASVKFDDPAIHSVIESMGGWEALCMTESSEWVWREKEFVNLYRVVANKRNHPEYLPGSVEQFNAPRLMETPGVTQIGEFKERKRLKERSG